VSPASLPRAIADNSPASVEIGSYGFEARKYITGIKRI